MSVNRSRNLPEYVFPLGKRGTLQFVRRVPEDVARSPTLQAEFGGRRVWKRTLGSSDFRVAKAAYAEVLGDFEHRLARARVAIRSGTTPVAIPQDVIKLRQPDDHDLRWIRDMTYQRSIASARSGQTAAFRSWDQYELQERHEDDRFPDGDAWRARHGHLEAIDQAAIDEMVLVLAQQRGLRFDDGTDVAAGMRMAVVSGRKAAYDTLLKSEVRSPLFDPSVLARKASASPRRVALGDVLADYLSTRKREPRWAEKLRVGVEEFEEFLGEPRPVDQIQRADVQGYVEALERCPTNRKQRFPGLSMMDAIAANNRLERPYPTLHPKTIKETKLATLMTLFNFAVDNRSYLSVSPAQRIKVSKTAHEDRSRQPFSEADMVRLFRHPIWTGCSDPRRPYSTGDKRVEDHRFWAPLLLAYTGARPGELAAVQLDEVVTEHSTPHLKIRWNEDGRLKTKNARREVPIFDVIRDIGFIDYVERLRREGEARLFPLWEKGGTVKDFTQAAWARAFNRTVVGSTFGKDEGSRYSLYSFRKNFKGLLIDAEVPLQFQHALMGHEPGEVERAYAGRISIERTYPRVHRLRYPQLDLQLSADGRLVVEEGTNRCSRPA